MSCKGKPWAKSLGEIMALVRDISGQSVREAAKRYDMSSATLHRIEHGYGCDVDQLVKIHSLTGISYDKLLGSGRNTGTKP